MSTAQPATGRAAAGGADAGPVPLAFGYESLLRDGGV